MGATNFAYKVKVGTDLQKWYQAECKRSLEYYGHQEGYNGTISTTRGIVQTSQTFTDERTAEEWILDNTEKWGVAKVVTVKENGKEYLLIGGWAAE